MRNYLKYKEAGRTMTLSKDADGRAFIQLAAFNPWTGAVLAPEVQEINPILLQEYINKLSSQLSSLQALQTDFNNLGK
jgi:hypothetical protein